MNAFQEQATLSAGRVPRQSLTIYSLPPTPSSPTADTEKTLLWLVNSWPRDLTWRHRHLLYTCTALNWDFPSDDNRTSSMKLANVNCRQHAWWNLLCWWVSSGRIAGQNRATIFNPKQSATSSGSRGTNVHYFLPECWKAVHQSVDEAIWFQLCISFSTALTFVKLFIQLFLSCSCPQYLTPISCSEKKFRCLQSEMYLFDRSSRKLDFTKTCRTNFLSLDKKSLNWGLEF